MLYSSEVNRRKDRTILNDIRNTQHLADLIKGIVLDAEDLPKDRRLAALRAVSRFERCGWHPGIMADVLAEVGASVAITDGALHLPGDTAAQLDTLEAVMRRYLEQYGFDDAPQLFTMREAADYLGISQSMMETYVIRRGAIRGNKIGRSWVFTREALDDFQANERRAPGRPPAEES